MTEISKIKIGDDTRDIKDTDTDTTYLPVVSGSETPGLMTGSDKANLDSLVRTHHEVTVSVTDIGRGASLDTGHIYLVYE